MPCHTLCCNPCLCHVRTQPSTNQEEAPHQKPNWPVPWSGTSQPPELWETIFWCVSPPVCVLFSYSSLSRLAHLWSSLVSCASALGSWPLGMLPGKPSPSPLLLELRQLVFRKASLACLLRIYPSSFTYPRPCSGPLYLTAGSVQIDAPMTPPPSEEQEDQIISLHLKTCEEIILTKSHL